MLLYCAAATGKGAGATVANVLVGSRDARLRQSIVDVSAEYFAAAARADAGSASAIEIGNLVAKALC
jgi:hypothetical protein